uniref:Segregation and condensation protein A n=1 Tax=candidate division WOR-3 bacterium TaxID=2052148 RepID=A0A7C4X8R1_UNCW3
MKIDIGIYYGPIDLLVYLVRKKEVDIFDIPIAQVAEEYLDYLRKIEREDLEDAADFLLMAAILIRLKVRSLLPKTPLDEEEVKPITLMQIIEEFKKYKEIARAFGEMEAEFSKQFPRFSKLESTKVLEKEDLSSLLLAFRSLRPTEETKLLMKRQEVPIGVIIEDIKNLLKEKQRVDFLKVLREKNNVPLAVGYFFGMLEVVKEGYAQVEQNELFGEIYLSRVQR